MSASENDIVQALVKAANAVHDAAKVMKNSKDSSRKISKISLEIATSIDNTSSVAHHRGQAIELPVSVSAALGATKDVFDQCASFMVETANKGAVTRYFSKGFTADGVGGYLAAVEGLRKLLKIRDDECKLMLEPFAGLGIEATCTKDDLNFNITSLDAAYDGLKTVLNVMVNITDGLEWPLKAAPQTFLYILQLFESCQGVRPKVTALLFSVQTLWNDMAEMVSHGQSISPQLRRHLSGFFETLQRIAIRLHIVLRTGHIKRAMAIHTVEACLDLEGKRLGEAWKTISRALKLDTHAMLRDVHAHITAPKPSVPHVRVPMVVLPPKPTVFHGRDEYVNNIVQLLTQPGTARIAILGAGGMGKTTLALETLHDPRIVQVLGDHRMFQSCEALNNADSLVGKLAEQCNIPLTTQGLKAAVVAGLTRRPHTLLVLDNLETIWLVDGAPVGAVDELLGTLAQIPSISLMITCRGIVLPQTVRWSNSSSASLEPFSLEAALETFQDRAERRLSPTDEAIAKELLLAVDMMPLAVTLLGRLAQRGTPVSELLEGWNIEHSALLQTHAAGRTNNVDVSIELSIKVVQSADPSQEALQLLSLCALLPDGLRPDVYEKLRPQFKNIRRARELLSAYALANLGSDRVLKALSPVRYFVLERYSAQPTHLNALHSIYFDIADQLPILSEELKDIAAAAEPEMGNLSSLLLTLIHQPSERIVEAVLRFTWFRSLQQPTADLAMALLPHVDGHTRWKADCLMAIGRTQYDISECSSSISSFATAAELYLEVNDPASAAECKRRCGSLHRLLGEYDIAVVLIEEARAIYVGLSKHREEARCRVTLGRLMRLRGDYSAAIEHLTAAHQTLSLASDIFSAAQCSESLGIVYTEQGQLESAVAELDAARTTFISIGDQWSASQSTRFLSTAFRLRGDFTRAEQLLREAENISESMGHRQGLAASAVEFGRLRAVQGRYEEAAACFESAKDGYEALGMQTDVEDCARSIQQLRQKTDV